MEAARRAGFRSAQAQPEPSPARIQSESSPNPAQSQPKASPKPARRSIGFRQTAIRSGLRNEPGLCLARLAAHLPQSRVFRACSAQGRELFFAAVRARKQRLFRSLFDSSQARKTVRQGRFWDLEFAPDFEAGKRQGGRRFSSTQPSPAQARTQIGFCRPSHSLGSRHEPGLPCPACGASAAKPRFSGFAPR